MNVFTLIQNKEIGKFDESNIYFKRMLSIRRDPAILGNYANNLYRIGRNHINESRQAYEQIEKEFSMTRPMAMAGYARVLSEGL